MKPEEFLKKTKKYAKEIKKAKQMYVAVGLPKEKIGSEIYGDGASIMLVGAIHEFAIGTPKRSFLKLPFFANKSRLEKSLVKGFRLVAEKGYKAEKALSLVGVEAVNISKDSFVTGGFGKWPDISEETKAAKKSSQILIDTGTLRNSITFVLRG